VSRPVALVLLVTLGLVRTTLAQHQAVTLHKANLRSGPRKTSTWLGMVPAGEILDLLPHGHQTGYYRVQRPSEEIGWVTESALRILDDAEIHHPTPDSTPSPGAPTVSPSVIAGAFDGCVIEGDPSPAGSQFHQFQERNRLKNRSAVPGDAVFDPSVTLAKLVGDGSDDLSRYDEGKAAEIIGWVVHVKKGGAETSNCGKTDSTHVDAHIELALSPTDTLKNRRVVVEITPRWREAMKAAGVDWSTQTLQHALEHHWIRVGGWLFADSEHKNVAENTKPGGDTNWRATVWELHPVTRLVVVAHP
jgi:hypothetical protein